MARPMRQGLEYFPLDVTWDDKVEMFIEEKGCVGLGILITLWQLIYGNKGYWILDESDLPLKVKKRINVDINIIIDVINCCLSRQLFNQKLHQKYGILTSASIQKRFFPATHRKKAVEIVPEFCLIPINDIKNAVIVDINSVITNINPQSRSKGNKSKGKEIPQKVNASNKSNWDFFLVFYERYPRKEGKQEAWEAWIHSKHPITEELLPDVMAGLERYLTDPRVTKAYLTGEFKWVKTPAAWINSRRWTDKPIKKINSEERLEGLLDRMQKKKDEATKQMEKKPIVVNPPEEVKS